MTDLRSALSAAASPTAAPGVDPEADLDRARRGARRERTRLLRVRGGIAVAAAGITTLALQLGPATAPTTPTAPLTPPAPSATLTLVTNSTEQPSGFDLAVIPDGWEVVYDDAFTFVLGPAGVANTDPQGVLNFQGRIAVMLQEHAPPVPGREPGVGVVTAVEVGGRPAVLAHDDGSTGDPQERLGAPTLWVTQPDGRTLVVQSPTAAALTDDQLIALTEGITVKPSARSGQG